jgi:primosomal replication protein N
MMGSKLFESEATAAALKCSTNFPIWVILSGQILRQKTRAIVIEGIRTHSYSFAHKSKLLLQGFIRCNLSGSAISAVKIPSVESREVLDRSKELVTTGNCRHELEVMGD